MTMTEHDALTRAQPHEWTDDGRMIYAEHDANPPHELLCRTCGDDLGPYDDQPAAIRRLRGPYANMFLAREALDSHLRQTRS